MSVFFGHFFLKFSLSHFRLTLASKLVVANGYIYCYHWLHMNKNLFSPYAMDSADIFPFDFFKCHPGSDQKIFMTISHSRKIDLCKN
jgi:hypothetical protein